MSSSTGTTPTDNKNNDSSKNNDLRTLFSNFGGVEMLFIHGVPSYTIHPGGPVVIKDKQQQQQNPQQQLLATVDFSPYLSPSVCLCTYHFYTEVE